MAQFQTSANQPLPARMTLFVGNVLTCKVVPGGGELVPFKMAISPPSALTLIKEDVRTGANFQIYSLKAAMIGQANFFATNAKGAKAGPIAITIKTPLALPSAPSDSAALTMLLLAEAPTPFAAGYNAQTAKSGMQWMRRVVQNRLSLSSVDVGSAGAKSIIDVIKARGQFEGFGGYPAIGTKQANNIRDMLAIANDGTHPKQQLFYDHISAALAVPGEKLIDDPCPTRLLGWRTAGASGPGGRFKIYKTFAGQDFYTIP